MAAIALNQISAQSIGSALALGSPILAVTTAVEADLVHPSGHPAVGFMDRWGQAGPVSDSRQPMSVVRQVTVRRPVAPRSTALSSGILRHRFHPASLVQSYFSEGMAMAVGWAVGLGLAASLPGLAARAEVQLRCDGTQLEARGSAEQSRPTLRLQVSLSLEAEAANTDSALAELQGRLAAVRSALQSLGVQEFRASSPSTWQRPAEQGRPTMTQASLQVTGRLLPQQLQPLIRTVGALAGVRLAPVGTESDPTQDGAVRRALLRRAYGDAQAQARELASVIGAHRLRPLEVVIDGNEMRPMLMRAAVAAPAPPPFDPAELPPPQDRLTMLVRFCAD